MPTVHDYEATTLDKRVVRLDQFQNQVVLIVNTASRCGFTPQYAGLQALYERYRARGFVVLGFPCNQFGAQEPGDGAQIAEFCSANYGVSFPMFEKIDVNGPNAHPLFAFLTRAKRGALGTAAIKWNFTKFLVARDGTVVARYAPTTAPEAIAADIEQQLSAP